LASLASICDRFYLLIIVSVNRLKPITGIDYSITEILELAAVVSVLLQILQLVLSSVYLTGVAVLAGSLLFAVNMDIC